MKYHTVQLLYRTRWGRRTVLLGLKAGVPKLMARYLCSPLSAHMIPRYIKRHHVPMEEYPAEKYDSFASFFARKKEKQEVDLIRSHLISPCDGWLSVSPILPNHRFLIKDSAYRICDLIDDKDVAKNYDGGLCMVFRLSASDYHHYICIDDGYVNEHHYIEGMLHSVQPISCDAFPVYRLNRRCWTVLETNHFGDVVQVEVGALAVGGIVNDRENTQITKGENMGHFELCGSTIVLLLRKDRVEILPEIEKIMNTGQEIRVSQGMWIATKKEEDR